MYQCRHFIIQELVPPSIYEARGEKAWELLDERALMVLDTLRDNYGPVIVNDWHRGGTRKWSGLRTPASPYYSETSQHSYGRAFDCLFLQVPVSKVRQEVLRERKVKYPYITGIELNVTWFHFDVRNHAPVKCFGA